jgi:hypothetical protein
VRKLPVSVAGCQWKKESIGRLAAVETCRHGLKRVGVWACGRVGVWACRRWGVSAFSVLPFRASAVRRLTSRSSRFLGFLVSMKSITRLRKFAKRRDKGYPVATLIFYGPDDKKASKAVLAIIASEGADPQLQKWFRKSPNADLRYGIDLQNTWLEVIRREGVRNVAMIEEINGCPHEEGVDYPLGRSVPNAHFGRTAKVQLSRRPPS